MWQQLGRILTGLQYILDATTAVAGLLMFGDNVRDEITSNILMESSYPRALTVLMTLFIAIIPLTKIPLNARPIVSTVEVLLGLHQQTVADSSGLVGRSAYFRGILKIAIRVIIVIVFLVIAIVFPAFDSIMAFMGSALCFTICVTYVFFSTHGCCSYDGAFYHFSTAAPIPMTRPPIANNLLVYLLLST